MSPTSHGSCHRHVITNILIPAMKSCMTTGELTRDSANQMCTKTPTIPVSFDMRGNSHAISSRLVHDKQLFARRCRELPAPDVKRTNARLLLINGRREIRAWQLNFVVIRACKDTGEDARCDRRRGGKATKRDVQREDRKKIKRGVGAEGLETRNTLYPGKRWIIPLME